MAQDRIGEVLSQVTWGGAGIGALGAITVIQWVAIGGFVLALAGFCVNWWHKAQMVKIAKERLEREYPSEE